MVCVVIFNEGDILLRLFLMLLIVIVEKCIISVNIIVNKLLEKISFGCFYFIILVILLIR